MKINAEILDSTAVKLNMIDTDNLRVALGFDGYVDDIISAVDSRENAGNYRKIPTITHFGKRILNAAGKSTNIELVTQKLKLGGNGPIMANAIAHMGMHVDYLGALGHPQVHKVFENMHEKFSYISIDEPGYTMAVEFDDGKIMFGRLAMQNLNWDSLKKYTDDEYLKGFFYDHDLIGMVNWTQTIHMSSIWDSLLNEFLPSLPVPEIKPFLFVDIADPEKRDPEDIKYMLTQLKKFGKFYRVILGLNEKESSELADIMKISFNSGSEEELMDVASSIRENTGIHTCVIHPVSYAVCAESDKSCISHGPYVKNPLISTGAGDHFNAGFCFGRIAGLLPEESLVTGVACSGYYVRYAKSATKQQLVSFINDWKNKKI